MKHLDSENDKKRNKVIALITTVALHSLLLICFVFMGLTYQVPPPPEYGIEVEMGGGGGGGGSTAKSQTTRNSSSPANSENISTQDLDETTTINTTKKPVTTNPTRQQPTQTVDNPVKDEPTVNPNALFNPRTSQGGEGGTEGKGKGSDGRGSNGSGGDGDGGHGDGRGGGIGSGDFFLNSRPVVNKAFPNAKNNLEGRVVVEFRADRDGNVVYAKAGGRGTTINDQQIWDECERAAKRSKFKAKSDAQIEERGTITYRFVLQ